MPNDIDTAFPWQDLCDESFVVRFLESVHDPVVVIDAEGTCIYVNPAYYRELGGEALTAIGTNSFRIAPEAIINKVLKSGKPISEQPSRILRLGLDIIVTSIPLYKNGVLKGAVSVFKNITMVKRLSEELDRMKNITSYLHEQVFPEQFKDIIGSNKNFRDTISRALKASNSEVTVLIQGETGTGKDLVAKAIHNASKRKQGPFIQINCAAIPENLLESELFGFEDGAFTGARRGGKPGKFELADGGTLFLDEIGDMSIVLQAKLLRALQEKEIERVGGTKSIPTDVRFIAATNQDLQAMMEGNKFRADFYFRLNVFRINMIPLRERMDDILLLSNHFLKKFTEREGKDIKLSSSAQKVLARYKWPGNVRELRNVIESAVVFCEREYIQIEDLPEYLIASIPPEARIEGRPTDEGSLSFQEKISLLDRGRILKAIEKAGNNRSEAMRMLKMSRSSFYGKIAKYGIK